MRRTSRLIRNAFLSLLAGVVLGGAVAGVLWYGRGPSRHLATGESSYQAGLKAVRGQEYDQALVRFHEAILSAENILKDGEESAGEPMPADQFEKRQQLLGQAYWLKHRALKARGFTRLLIEHKPLPTFEGQSDGPPDVVLTKLSVLRLPEDQTRREALASLREAAYRLPASAEVLREAVATEIQIDPMQWNFVHAFATTLVELDPKDERARYLAARLEYEQPIAMKTETGSVTLPMPANKRSRDRMLKGLEHIARLKELEPAPRWRTLQLEAQIEAWLVHYYRQPTVRKVDAELDILQRLRTLLFEPQQGVLARAAKEERAGSLSRLDLQGLYGLHQMALELVMDESRRALPAANQPEAQRPWIEQVQKVMDACVALVGKTKGKGRIGDAADFLTQAALKAMPYLASTRPEVWTAYRSLALDLANQARTEKLAEPSLCLRIGELLNKDTSGTQRDEALTWLEDGLKLATGSTHSLAKVLPLHEARLRLLLGKGASRETIKPHLDALRNSKQEGYVAAAAFYEGVVVEQEGRLDISRQLFEQAARSPRADLNRRALTRLIPLYLTLEMPDRALTSLNELDRQLARIETLSPEEKAWFYSFVRGPGDLALYRVQAHVLAATQARQRLKLAGTKQERDLTTVLARHEVEVRQWLNKVPPRTPADAQARAAWTQYLLQWDQFDEAGSQVAILKRDHPELLQTLQLEIGLTLGQAEKTQTLPVGTIPAPLPGPVMNQVDGLIQAYLKHPKGNPAARLVWLKWLETTGRQSEAQKTLADPTFFAAAGIDPPVQKIKALATIYCGTKEQTKSVLDALPHDPQIDVALLQMASSMTEQQEVLGAALRSHQDAGLFRAWSAALALARGDHVDACKGFLSCMEYTRARPLVRQGLTQALLALAQNNPQEARKVAVEGLQSYPSESSLLLGFAYASLQLGEFGSPADSGEQVKDMATALRAFEAACALENQDAYVGPWVQAQFWMMANRTDLARLEVVRTLERAPKHEPAILLAVQLMLEQNEPASLAPCEKLIAVYRQLKPHSPEGAFWQAKYCERIGKKNDALACYRELMDKHPRYLPAYVESVAILLSVPNAETLAACRQTIDRWRAIAPTDPLCGQAEIRLLATQGKLPETRQWLTQQLSALESKRQTENPIQPVSVTPERQHALAKANLTALLTQGLMKANQWSEAEAWLSSCVQACSEHQGAMALLAEVYVHQMNQQPAGSEARTAYARKAIDLYSQLYRRQKGQLVIGNNLAWLLVTEMNDANEALRITQEVRLGKHFSRPLPGDQLGADFLDTIGQIHEKLGRADLVAERVELFEAARRRHPQDARVFVHLGAAYLAAKELKRAEQAFTTAQTLLGKSMLSAERQRSLKNEIDAGLAKTKRG